MTNGATYIKRFNVFHRTLHALVATSFLGLAASGMPLRYSEAPWAIKLMHIVFGSYHAAGIVHRVCALVTFAYFFAHVVYVIGYVVFVRKGRFNVIGPESMVPRWKDIQDVYRNFKWFLGVGPKPRWDRWTYWEKFDYWASFCGVGVIGTSGLVLWFPEFFTNFFPGWVVNVAIIIHSDGALLASAFIFTIHFFHTHLRPEKFPMDTAIFIGRLTLDEMERDRPIEYERLTKEGKMGERMISPPSPWLTTTGILFGELLLLMGFALLFLILVGEFFS